MILLVGLGNPAAQYEKTRHNLGAGVVDALRRSLHLDSWDEKPDWGCILVKSGDLLLMLPQTFMNDSGRAVQAVARWYNILPQNIWVVSDDVDLALGETRIRHDGSAGGHKGLQSVMDALKSERFHRFRIGIGSNRSHEGGDRALPSEVYVLQKFSEEEERQLNEKIPSIVRELRLAIGLQDPPDSGS